MNRDERLTKKVWAAMHKRCIDPSYANFHWYGGRGIKVCARWKSFDSFVGDMGLKPAGHQLDRVDNDGDYSPENCRWVTPVENNRNRSVVRYYEHAGTIRCVADWAKQVGMSKQALFARLKRGWSFDEAVSTPIGCRRANALAAIKKEPA